MHDLQNEPPATAVHGIHPQLTYLAVPIDALTPDPTNARDHDKRNIESIILSYKHHGQRKPIVVQESSRDGSLVIRAGNGQHAAAKRLGWTHLAAVIVDESDPDAVVYALRDNRTAELAGWNLPNLGEQLRYVRHEGYSIGEVGWEPFEADPLMAAEWEPPQLDPNAAFNTPEKRVSLMFTRKQWEELKDILAAKPSADLVLARLRGDDDPDDVD